MSFERRGMHMYTSLRINNINYPSCHYARRAIIEHCAGRVTRENQYLYYYFPRILKFLYFQPCTQTLPDSYSYKTRMCPRTHRP